MHAKSKSIALTILELLAFNTQKLRGPRDQKPREYLKNFYRVKSGLSLEACTSNLKSVALTILELLAFNAQKFSGHVTLPTPLYEKFWRGHVRTVPGNMCFKCEVRSFNHFKLVWLTSLLRTDTHTQTENVKRKQYFHHSFSSLCGVNNLACKNFLLPPDSTTQYSLIVSILNQLRSSRCRTAFYYVRWRLKHDPTYSRCGQKPPTCHITA